MVRVPKGSASSDGNGRDVSALLARSLRGHQPAVQGIRRRRRICESLNTGNSRSSRTAATIPGKTRWRASAIERAVRARHLGARHLSAKDKPTFRLAASVGSKRPRLRRLPASRCQPRFSGAWPRDFAGPSGVFGDILVHSNFNGKGTDGGRYAQQHRSVRAVRHGRQRQGMVLERIARRPDDPRRRLERAEVHV